MRARQQVSADDPERLPRRGTAARPGVRAAGRKRLQAERAVAREGQGRLAVHGRHGAGKRPAARLVHRRALGPGKSHPRGGQVPADAEQASSAATGIWRWRPTTAARAGCSARSRPRGVDDFWTLAEKPKAPAARDARIRADDPGGHRHRAKPGAVRFRLRTEAPAEFDKVTLPRPVDLRRVAEWTDTSIDEIQALNPELRRWTTPVRDTSYELKVPAGTARTCLARLDGRRRPPTSRRSSTTRSSAATRCR